jgi:hypothetical protein
MCERAQLLEPVETRTMSQFLDQGPPNAERTRAAIDHQRSDLRHAGAQWRQLGASDNPAAASRDDETVRVNRQLTGLARQQPAFFEMCRDQAMQRRRLAGSCGTVDDLRRGV